jgi:putative DNA primase/helicase
VANCSLAEITSLCARNRMPKTELSDYIKLIADKHQYNPVADWITSQPWDGISRLPDLYATVTSPMPQGMKETLIYRWLISAVAAIFTQSGFSCRGVLVFQGRQSMGKTKWVKSLVPDAMGVVLDGATLDPADKDSVMLSVSHWLVELGELDATFRKADIARLKGFVTKTNDKLRRPYDRIESEYQRRTVFFASVNESNYLVDDTGNSRWWTVPVSDVNFAHGINMQQVWAELLVQFQAGAQWWLEPAEEEELNMMNADHEAIDPVEELLRSGFDWAAPAPYGYVDMTATQVLLSLGYDRVNKSQATHASKVLKKITGRDPVKRNDGRYFSIPPRSGKPGQDDGKPY